MGIAPGLRPSVLAARQRLAEGREKIRQRHARGSPGVQVCVATADLLDAVVLDLYRVALADLGEDGPQGLEADMALVAHGGYGRRDVAPFSDVDLMVLHTPAAAGRVARLAERLMRDVFDAGLILGHSVRTVEQSCSLALDDATICTSLVESRYLTGSEPLYARFLSRFKQRIARRSARLIDSIDRARQEERNQFGETVYLLEPNLKRSRGGLRDIQLLRWIGFVAYGAADPDDLLLRDALSKSDQQAIRQAWEFLLRLRNEMHFHAGKANDVLDRAEQVRLAEAFGYTAEGALLPVERFMRDYFQHTDAVSHIVNRFVEGTRPHSPVMRFLGYLFSHQVEGDYRVEPTQIAANRRGLAKLRGNLEEALRLVDLANMYNKRIDHRAIEAIRGSTSGMAEGVSPIAAARFLSLLSQPARLGELLRLLHEVGVLERIVPAFRHARCLLQFNEYHKYTVDEHCLRAVERATEFLGGDGPASRVYRRIKQKRTLHLALLIHDLGKGHAEDHSDVGLRIADDMAGRLRLPDREAETLKFLVHKHLLMSHLAFRRDTSDEQLVLRFAVEVGSPEAMQMLFVLTCADLAAVGPGVLNDWKIEVLADLHKRAMRHLAGDAPSLDSQDRLRQQRDAVRCRLGVPEDARWFERQVEALPSAYLESRGPEQIAAELRELHGLSIGDVLARGCYRGDTRTVEYTIGTHESIVPGVFHRLTGALSGKGLEILSAEINTLADGLVLDRFWVVDPDFADEPPAARLQSVEAALAQALIRPTEQPPTFRRTWQARGTGDRAGLPGMPTRVRIDNNTSDRFTVIDVFTADRRGLLYTITRMLFELGLSVSVAKIGTYLDQVVDVFYVTDTQGRKIEGEERLNQIRARLLAEIESFARQEAEPAATR
jgi:[protein-PII] uridylyltransferase